MRQYEAHNKRMRQSICDAMVRLLEDRPFLKVTVRDILQEAHIQRATFYRYFRDKYEVAEAINRTVAEDLTKAYFEVFYARTGGDPAALGLFDEDLRQVTTIMLRLRIDDLDLIKTLRGTFLSFYRQRYPDCGEFEGYVASANFLSFVLWFAEKATSQEELAAYRNSNALSAGLARFYGVPADALLAFLQQNQVPPSPAE